MISLEVVAVRKYTAELISENGEPLAFLENANEIVMQGFRLNQPNTPAFVLPLNDPKIAYFKMDTRFRIYRNAEILYSGKIKKRGADNKNGKIAFKGMTNELELDRLITPDNWPHLNNRDLADAIRYLLKGWETVRINTYEDWKDHIVYSENLDGIDPDPLKNTDPGKLFIARNRENLVVPIIDLTIPVDRFSPYALARVQTPVPAGATEVEAIRWTQVVGEAKTDDEKVEGTYIEYRYRLSTNGGSTWGDWSAWFGKNAVSDHPENEGFVIPITGLNPADNNLIQADLKLVTENTSAPAIDWEDLQPEDINTLGITPELHAVEIIFRKPWIITEGSIPASTGVTVEGFEFNRDNHLDIISQLCKDYGYEYRVNDDLTFDLVEEFGTVHETPFVSGDDCTITNLSDEMEVVNRVECLGAGEGPNQLRVIVRDEASIQNYGEYPDTFEDTSIDNIDDLKAEGKKKLQPEPLQRFEIEIPHDSKMPFIATGDTITVLIPEDEIEVTGRVLEWSGGEAGKGELNRVALDSPQPNIMDHIIQPKKIKKKLPGMHIPSQVRASGGYGYIHATWSGNADYYLVQQTQTPGDSNSWRNTGGKIIKKEYILTQLPIDTKIYIRVAAVKDGRMSLWSQIASGKTKQVPPEDIQRPTPSVPQNLTVASTLTQPANGIVIISNMLSWTPPNAAEKITDVNIERKKLSSAYIKSIHCPDENGPYYDTDGLEPAEGYEYRIRYVNEWNQKSDWTSWKAITTPSAVDAPAKPTGVVATPYFSKVSLRCNPNSDVGLAGYEWKRSSGTNPDTATVMTGNKNTISYSGTYGEPMNFWVRAYTILDSQKYYSEYSDMVIATPGKIDKTDMTIFENGVLASEIITDVLNAHIINVGDAYSLEPDGIKDSDGYVIVDPNGFNGKIVFNQFVQGEQLIDYHDFYLGSVIVPEGKRLIGVVSPTKKIEWDPSFPDNEIIGIEKWELDYRVVFNPNTSEPTEGYLMPGNYYPLRIRVYHAVSNKFTYPVGGSLKFLVSFDCYCEIKMVNM